ncbi:MAG TPA: hypothetical protein VLD58_05265 [Gemmatimonadales bacterium]|nr:hypothetical protein [Gemmatimonadales bacterium]
MSAPRCPHCSIGLTEGFLLEEEHHARTTTKWVEGVAERSFWGLRLKGKLTLPVSALRCPRCGFLALYAAPVSPGAQ